jgi:hypothetical protein
MATTYLTLVNDVLTRLRETTVASVSENDYSALIGKLVNDAKREVEDAWNWECLKSTYTIATSSGTTSYALDGAGQKFRLYEAVNDTNDWYLRERSAAFMTENYSLLPSPVSGPTTDYAFNGLDVNGDVQVDVYPQPDAVYTLRFNGFTPEAELSANSDQTKLPKSPIVALAWAKAIEERGEDGGVNVSSQYAVAKQSLADHIAIEAGRRPEESIWYWV